MRGYLTVALGLVLAGAAMSCDSKNTDNSGENAPAAQTVKVIPGVSDEWIEERRVALQTELGTGWKVTAKRKVNDADIGLGVHFFGVNETIRFDPPGPKGERYASVQLYLHPLAVKEPLALTESEGSLYSIVLGETDLHRVHGGFVLPDGQDRDNLLSAVRGALGVCWNQPGKPLTEQQARMLAARLATDAFAEKTFKHPNGEPVGKIEITPESFRSVSQKDGRWVLRMGGVRGPEALVDFALDGTDAKVTVDYAWD